MSEELKPCPFCGKKASIQDCSYYGSAPAWSAMCDNPTCFAYTEAFKTKKEAIERWNNRPAEEALQKRIAELEAERDRLRKALQGLMQAVDGCLTPSEVLLWKKCEEALKGAGDVEKNS